MDASIGEQPARVTDDTDNGDVIRILPATTYTHKSLRASQEWEYRGLRVQPVWSFRGNLRDSRRDDPGRAKEPTAPAGLKLIQGL